MSGRRIPLALIVGCIAILVSLYVEAAGTPPDGAVSVDASVVSAGAPSVRWQVTADGSQTGGAAFDKLKVGVFDADGRSVVSEWRQVDPPGRGGKQTALGTIRVPALYAQKDMRCEVTLYGRGISAGASSPVRRAGSQPSVMRSNEAASPHLVSYQVADPPMKADPPARVEDCTGRSEPTIDYQVCISDRGVGLETSIEWRTDPHVVWDVGWGVPIWQPHHRHHERWLWPYGRVTASRRGWPGVRCEPHLRTGWSFILSFGD